MMAPEYIITVTESDFDYEVVNYSQNTPVLVDFWASWCIPCKVLSPMLERLAHESQGAFRLAKVNVDENPRLSKRFNIRSIPAVKAFNQSQVVAEFSGVLAEGNLKEFVHALIPEPTDLIFEKATSLLVLHQWQSSEQAFRQFLESNHTHPQALLGLTRSLMAQGHGREAIQIIRDFPASREFNTAQVLRPLAELLASVEQGAIRTSEDPLEAAFYNCIRLAGRSNLLAAIDGLLDILRQDKKFKNGLARQLVVALLGILGDEDPQTRQYRSELAAILF